MSHLIGPRADRVLDIAFGLLALVSIAYLGIHIILAAWHR